MITATEARSLTAKALLRKEQATNERVEGYVESLTFQVAQAARRGEKHLPKYFNLPMTLWDKVYWRLAQMGYAVYYRQATNEIDIWW